MGILDKLKDTPKLLFKAKKHDPSKYVGRTVVIEGKKVVIKKIVGNITKPQFYEINGEHLIGMLRLEAQMTAAKDITEDDFLAFEQMDLKAERIMDEQKTIKEVH